MLKCGQCNKYIRFGGEGGHGACSLPETYFTVNSNDDCHYLHKRKLTCKDCSHFGNDYACLTAEATDDVCCGYQDKLEYELFEILFHWAQRGEYSRQKLNNLCAMFEQTDLYKLLSEHVNMEDKKMVDGE